MKELIVATKNKGKLREIKELLKGFELNITSLAEYPDAPEIIEDGKDFSENALIKARIIAEYWNITDIRDLYRNDLKQLREAKVWIK